ncbi:hypothetical protein HGB07_02085 [Candidatus Roizmanbacteria bacterium]|nr:hypothetical protein [Candidatus Roizmanbacteria bacterium]
MLPTLLIVNNLAESQLYIDKLVREEQIPLHSIIRVSPEKEEITIGQVRDLKQELVYTNSVEKIVIIESFDTASIEAQNALLKTLEEKQDGYLFILIAYNQERILPTIQSRCTVTILKTQQGGDIDDRYKELVRLIETIGVSILGTPSISGITREDAIILIDSLLIYFRNNLTKYQKLSPHYRSSWAGRRKILK